MDRRRFLKKGSMGTLLSIVGPSVAGAELREARTDEPLRCAVIGFGPQGRDIAAAIEDIPEMALEAICDDYPIMLRRAQRSNPDTKRVPDYRAVLDDPAVQAVFIATPTHLHRHVAIDALAAGKHVYCEAPMAATVDDARAMAEAAASSPDQVFQVGLHLRTEPQYRSVFGFIRSGALGKPLYGKAQWHAKDSWRRPTSDPARQKAMDWRLDPELSLGMVGELGLQQIDGSNWVFAGFPTAVHGFSSRLFWNDGRTVPDTVQTVFEYEGGQRLMWDATLASSFDSAYELYYGSDATIMLREQKAWMFKEVDAPQLGWEVYARRDRFYKETGIALLANATKLDAIGTDPTADDPNQKSPLWHALKAFADNYFFGPFPPVADANLGFATTVLAVAARDAVRTGNRVTIEPSEYLP